MNLKNILTTLLFVFFLHNGFSQSILSVHDLELKKLDSYHEIVPAPEAKSRALVVFAADRATVIALRYTSVLYYTDSLVTERPDEEDYDYIAGYSYDTNRQPSAYWVKNDFKKIQEIRFDFEKKAVSDYFYELPFKDEEIITTFSENNSFYIVALPKLGSKLKLYIFNNGRYVMRTVDFSEFNFTDADNNKASFNRLFDYYTLQKIDKGGYNPLPATVSKLKLYVTEDALTFSFNQNPLHTQLLRLDLESYAVTEKIVPQVQMEDAKSNSFLLGRHLYQVAFNRDEIALSRTHLDSLHSMRLLRAGREQVIGFKNSDLLIQMEDNRQGTFKNTKKFLRRANGGSAAISVYQTPNDLLVVAGAIRYIVPAQNAVIGVAMATAGIDSSELFPPDIQTVYFESLFNDDFNHKPVPQERLAADYIGQYMAQYQRVISLQTVFKYDYYYVLGYYDAKAKKYVLVRFEDDFVN